MSATSNVPVPDPSILTTAQLDREVTAAKELFETKLGALKELTMSKFADSKEALEAAFEASKEAGLKSEQQFTKQIDGLTTLISANQKASDDKINDLKNSQSTGEGRTKGIGDFAGWIVAIIMVIIAFYRH
jgi:hypothetical protein